MLPEGARWSPKSFRILAKVFPESTLAPKEAPKWPKDPQMLQIGGPRVSKMLQNPSQTVENEAQHVGKTYMKLL